jgi:hypothetical protein
LNCPIEPNPLIGFFAAQSTRSEPETQRAGFPNSEIHSIREQFTGDKRKQINFPLLSGAGPMNSACSRFGAAKDRAHRILRLPSAHCNADEAAL